jgi:hypothetical protein
MAMFARNRIVVDDRSAKRPQLDIDTKQGEIPPWMHEFRQLLEDVVTVEDWGGREIPLPADHIAAEEVRALREAAHTIRERAQTGVVTIGLAMPPDEADRVLGESAEIEVATTWELNVFGMVIPLGRLAGKFVGRQVGERQEVEDGDVAFYVESVGEATLQLVGPGELDAAAA